MDYSSEEEFDNYLDEQLSISTRKLIRDFQNPFDFYSSEEFQRRYRFTKDVVLVILLPLLNVDLEKITGRGLPVLPIYQLLVALRFYASGSFQMVTGDIVSVSQPTASRIVKRVSHLFCLKLHKFIKFPRNLQRTKEDFFTIASFPGIIGAIACTHIPIQNPGAAYGEAFKNPEKFFSINTQIVCGPNLEIYDIVADSPGSVHDNVIFLASSLKRKIEQCVLDGTLLGDGGYNCQRYLLTPVAEPESISKKNYNEAHIKTRNTVERTIGAWKRIFPCLSKKMATSLTTTCNIIVATAVLYNICRAHGVIEKVETDTWNIRRTSNNVYPLGGETSEAVLFRRLFITHHF